MDIPFEPALMLRVAWSATYTYILLFFAAAAFVAYIARPREHGEAQKRLYAGELISSADDGGDNTANSPASEQDDRPRLHVRCLEGAKVVIERLGYGERLTASGAVSIAATFIGKNVEISERFTPGYSHDEIMAGARFVIEMAGQPWRHIKWTDDDTGLWCAFSLHVREGIDFTVEMKR